MPPDKKYPDELCSGGLHSDQWRSGELRPEQPHDAPALLALAAQNLGLPHCRWLERLRRSPDFLPELSLTLWAEEKLLAQAMLLRLPLCVHRQRLHALVAAPVLTHADAAPGTGARLLAQGMQRAAEAGYTLLALPLEPSYYRHAGFVPLQTGAHEERSPFAAGVPFILKGLGQEHEMLAQSLTSHLIMYTHVESLL